MKKVLVVGIIGISSFLIVSSFVAPSEKQYSVTHTIPEWQHQIQGLAEVQRVIHTSDLPAHEAFYCDSVLQSVYMDINRQVVAGMTADTTKTKKP